MKGPIQSVLEDMTETQVNFICDELEIEEDLLLNAEEDELEDIYYILCDIEISEIPDDDSEISDRCKLASDIVTLWGNAIAEEEGYLEETLDWESEDEKISDKQ